MRRRRVDDRRAPLELTRRDAIRLGAAASAIGIAGFPIVAGAKEAPAAVVRSGPGHVVEVHQPGMWGKVFPHAESARQMVNRAVTTLAGEEDLARAWSRFVSRDDRVGIKINCLGGRMASTMKEVVDPVVEGLLAAGVAEENIMIFDQFGGNMRGARYQWQDKPGKLRVINHQVLGYDDVMTETTGAKGRLAKTLLWTTAVINVPCLKDHDLVGITCAIKNMVFGCVEKPQLMHQNINVGMPHFYALEAIRGRVRLNIVDASFCLYDGGPKHNPDAIARFERVFATTDPVAADAVALQVIEEHRAAKRMRRLDQVRRPAAYLPLAEELGLGIADLQRIRLEKIELPPFVPAA